MLMMKTQVTAGKGSFHTFCQLNLPNSGKYIAANPYNSVVELNAFFLSQTTQRRLVALLTAEHASSPSDILELRA